MPIMQRVCAIHPDYNLSESTKVIITDCNNHSEFDERWSEVPDKVQAKFGHDLPLWDANEGPLPRRQKSMTFDGYVQLVTNYKE